MEIGHKELRIGEVARAAGLRASAIRYYEERGLLQPARRRGGARVYDAAVLDRLALIALAKGAGFSLSEIRRLLAGFSRRTPPVPRWRALAETVRPALARRLAETQRVLALLDTLSDCACPTLEDCGRALRERR